MANLETAIITASASILVAALSFYWTKKKEMEADWRKKKLEMYDQLFSALAGIVDGNVTQESRVEFAKATNTIGLIASVDVINAMEQLRFATKPENRGMHDEALTKFVIAVRKDLGLPLITDNTFVYRLWSSGV